MDYKQIARQLRNRVAELGENIEWIEKETFDKIWYDQHFAGVVNYYPAQNKSFNRNWEKVYRYAVSGEVCGGCGVKQQRECGFNI